MANKKRIPRLAKLTPPRLHGAIARERLFTVLDDARCCPAIWIAAPPGAGKTTLVASWIQSRHLPTIWYQVDAGDADLGSFFYYLGLAERCRSFGSRALSPLPLLTPEHLPDLYGFARRFFREWFDRLPTPALLVLDNVQEVGTDTAFHEILRIAVEEAPDGFSIVIVSRFAPTDDYAILTANRRIRLVDWTPLKLTRDESLEMARLHAPLEDDVLEELHQRSGGWPAGLILLAEQLRRGASVDHLSVPETLYEVFSYFAGQLFQRFEAEARRNLLYLSYLPSLSGKMAEALTGSASSAQLLEQLYRRQLFTDRRSSTDPVYEFHALFRAFLQHRARTEFDTETRRSVAIRASELLESAGRAEDALRLRCEAKDWGGAERLVLDHAMPLISQGRWRVVENWIAEIPTERVDANWWLLHWRGTAWIGVDPPHARTILERCHDVASSAGDFFCVAQAAAGSIETYFLEYADFRPLDRWIAVLTDAIGRLPSYPTVESELRVQAALLIALAYRQPGHTALDECARRVCVLLPRCRDRNLTMIAAFNLGLFGCFCGRMRMAEHGEKIMLPLLDCPDVTLFAKGMALGTLMWYSVLKPDVELGREMVRRLEDIGREQNLQLGRRFACILGYYGDARRGDLESAQARIDRFETIMNHADQYEVASLAGMRACQALFRNEAAKAAAMGPDMVVLYERTGSICHELFMRAVVVWAYVETGAFDEARSVIAAYREFTAGGRIEWMAWGVDTGEVWIALKCEDPRLPSLLRSLFSKPRLLEEGYGMATIWSKRWMPLLCAKAIELGIEPDNACHYIRTYDVDAPGQRVEAWPWKIRIRCLGPFEILIDDRPMDFGVRTPRKQLALLKAIIALGVTEVPEARLVDALWPDDDGDTAHRSFTTTLHRLRKLLGDNSLVKQRDAKVSLDTRRIWIDLLAFEEETGTPSSRDLGRLYHSVDLYRGEFLAGEDASWALSRRTHARALLFESIAASARHFEHEGRHETALDLYRRGIAADELAETFHLGVIRCQHTVGRASEARDAYHRMRDLLVRVHGIGVSQATESWYRRLFKN